MGRSPDDKMLCYCRNVRYGEVRASIKRINARTTDQVAADCDAGTGCRTCRPEVEALIQEHAVERPSRIRLFFRRIFARL